MPNVTTDKRLRRAWDVMIADGFPKNLLLSPKEREQSWKKNPPKSVVFQDDDKVKRDKELRAEATRLEKEAARSRAQAQADKTPVDTSDHTGQTWDVRRSRWVPIPGWVDPARAAPPKKTAAKKKAPSGSGLVDKHDKIVAKFACKDGTNKQKLLLAMIAYSAEPATAEFYAREVYGDEAKVGALSSVLKGLEVAIEKGRLPYGIEKSEKGWQLHEA
jgi:hypothetical protein